jgi:uncharacterized protein YndB with AHSA1/START domain
MSTASSNASTPAATVISGSEFTMERIFHAPRELLFEAWSDPNHLVHWWSPKPWEVTVCKVDFRPGGLWVYGMKGPDGSESWGRAIYREIVKPERIVFVDSFADDQGNPLSGMPEMVITVDFIDLGDQSKIKFNCAFANEADLQKTVGFGMVEGLNQCFAQLDEYLATKGTQKAETKINLTLPSDREIRMSRIFDAPRDLVFKALTDPNLLAQWWGPNNTTTIIDTLEFRVGGAWRFVQRDPTGEENAFRGEFREIVPPERVVQTFEWEGLPGHILVETMTLEDLDGKTRITTTSLFDSKEDRDGMLSSGMEVGANESWDRLAKLLAEQQD